MGTKKEILLGTLLLAAVFFLFEFSLLDLIVEDALYGAAAQHWFFPRENESWQALLFYRGIKYLIIFAGAGFFAAYLFSFVKRANILREYRRGLLIVCLSMILVPTFVGVLKTATNTPCPSECERYGGAYPYITVLDPMPLNISEKFRCFPAGHASGGFALMSLYFLFRSRRNKVLALTAALGTGSMMGFYKMAMGDHYLSHTLITLLLSWLIIRLIDAGLSLLQENRANTLVLFYKSKEIRENPSSRR
jgi:membrane-associated PAP2 superfamily phosphatase